LYHIRHFLYYPYSNPNSDINMKTNTISVISVRIRSVFIPSCSWRLRPREANPHPASPRVTQHTDTRSASTPTPARRWRETRITVRGPRTWDGSDATHDAIHRDAKTQVASFCSSAPCEYDLVMQTRSTKPDASVGDLIRIGLYVLCWPTLCSGIERDCRSALTVIALKHTA
jgi:hypothetical protein